MALLPQLKPRDPDSALGVLVRLLTDFGRRYTSRYALALLLLAISAATSGLTAWLLSDIVDQVFLAKNATMLFVIAAAIIVISLIRGSSVFGATVLLTRIGNAIVARAQSLMFDRVLGLGVEFHDRTHSSELITRMSTNANAARQVLDIIVTSFGRDILTLVALVVVMIIQSP